MTTVTLEICFNDLTPSAKAGYMNFHDLRNLGELDLDMPIATISREIPDGYSKPEFIVYPEDIEARDKGELRVQDRKENLQEGSTYFAIKPEEKGKGYSYDYCIIESVVDEESEIGNNWADINYAIRHCNENNMSFHIFMMGQA